MKDKDTTTAKQMMQKKFGKDYAVPKAPQHYAEKLKESAKPMVTKRMPDDASQKIEVLSKQNPHKPGSNRALAFDCAVKAKTVGQYLLGGASCKHKYLAVWAKSKLIALPK